MAMVKYADAKIVHPAVTRTQWANIRVAGKGARVVVGKELNGNLIERASELMHAPFDPTKFLLTHATIIASVDVQTPPGVKMGSVMLDGFKVNRRYGDYVITPETDKYINNNCFIPGTPITMADGTVKPIEDIEVGDMVLTHKGRARKVTETFVHNANGVLFEVKVRGTDERLYVTREHPFFVFRPNRACVECGGEIPHKIQAVSHLVGKHYCSKECYYKKRVSNEALLRDKVGEFHPVRDLGYGDFATVPVLQGEESIVLTLGQARLLGLFLADGYYELGSRESNARVGVIWAFHQKERGTLAKTVCDLMRSEFGSECVIREVPGTQGITVTTRTDRKAADFFFSWVLGDGDSTKTLHPSLLRAPLDIQLELVRGWLDGDGSGFDTRGDSEIPGDFRVVGSTASRSLVSQMQLIFHRLGISPRMSHAETVGRRRLVVDGVAKVVSDPTKTCHSWHLSCGAGWVSDLVETTRFEASYLEAMSSRGGGVQNAPKLRFLNGYVLQMITDVSPVEYTGKVHNFETEEDHSYVAGGFAVHNSDAWSRGVLAKAYSTFIGGHNFVEHVQVEELSKGRLIDAVSRDVGDSLYVDLLIATDLKHEALIKDIRSGAMSTLSMGCFLPGTQVSLSDGRRIAIEEVQPGDFVLTHKGRAREVLNKQIRGGKWDIRKIKAVGVPDTIEATDNHPFFVFRQPNTCACGCGEALPEYKGGRKNATRGLKRRFLRGHDKRILNPNNTYSMKEYQERKARLDAIQDGDGQWVRADDLRVGDFVCFPRVQAEGTAGISEGKARLLGYYLAEGSFQKYKGALSAVEFSFSMTEKGTFVAEVVRLLRQEFPGKEPNVYDHPHRNVCSVRLGDREAARWFFKHGGEYSSRKVLSAETMAWSVEAHKHLIGAWINGDGHLHGIHEHTSGTTTSYDLACQMHLLMSRCGWVTRMEAKIGARCVEVREIVNGGCTRDEATGKLPHFNLIVGKTQAVSMSSYAVNAVREADFDSQRLRVRDDVVIFPITSIEKATYEGWVHNMEVDEDNSYVVSGICSHNCTVDGTICTKCGHWAADETEMCFPTGTRVLTADGKYVPIEEVVEGDLVITHTGAVQPVLHTMGRHHDGNVTVLNVEGVPQPVRATTGHRFWVMRPETHCQCGCGELLHRTVEHERGSVKAFQRRFLPGHNSKVVGIATDREAKLGFVPAKDIRKGDYLTFPIPQQVTQSPDATEAKARLIGFFLAEGSFIKRDGVLVGVSFDFGAHEYETLAAEVEGLLNNVWGREERRTADFDWQTKVASEGIKPVRRRKTSRPVPSDLTCPSCAAPSEYAYNVRFKKGRDDCYQCKVCNRHWVEGADRTVKALRSLTCESTCTVRLLWAGAAEWFHTFCGEYAHGKVLAPEVMYWPQDVQKHVLFGWFGGDGIQSRLGITGNTASFDLISQMHVMAARCGWYSRKQVTFDRRAAILDEVVNGSGPVTVRDSNGWLPSFSLTVDEPAGFGGEVRFSDPENARVTLSGITDGFKRVGNYLLYRVCDAWNECFSGQVHNIEVAGDESYVVEGLAVHNCPHIKYMKGNTFYDEQGRRHRIAELCGHESLDPTGGVTFIEASWVGTPAFTGAVLRNVLEPSEVELKKVAEVLSTPPTQWAGDAVLKAASAVGAERVITKRFTATEKIDVTNDHFVEATRDFPGQMGISLSAFVQASDSFLAGWEDAVGEPGADEAGDGDAAPAEANPIDDMVKRLEDYAAKEVERRLRDRMQKQDTPAAPPASSSMNETLMKQATVQRYLTGLNVLVRTAASDAHLVDSLAWYNRQVGIDIPVQLYRAALMVGATSAYEKVEDFRIACDKALGKKTTLSEAKILVRIGKLLSRRSTSGQGSRVGSRQGGLR